MKAPNTAGLMAVLVLVLVAMLVPSVWGQACPSGWSQWGDHCYQRDTASRSFASQESHCVSRGGHLVSVHSMEENNWLYHTFLGGNWAWMGLSDGRREGTWEWTDGTPFDFDGWAYWEPNNSGNEDCAHFWTYGQRQLACTWNDWQCGSSTWSICKRIRGCGPGYYSPSSSSSSCSACPKGKYRETKMGVGVGSCSNCPAGRVGTRTAETNRNCGGGCPHGKYCPAGTQSGSEPNCKAGYYGNTNDNQEDTCDGPCTAGRYCNAGSNTPSPGTYCNAGRYGSVGQSSASCSGPCSEGYYCSSGSSSPTQHACGGDHVYCPAGSSSSTAVADGHYSIGLAGKRSGQKKCEAGYWCRKGTRYPCPAGRYGDEEGLESAACSGPCTAGYFCPEGSTSPTATNCGAVNPDEPARYYCPTGTPVPIDVNADEFPVGVGATFRPAGISVVASSEWAANHGAAYSGLNTRYTAAHTGSWSARHNNGDQWLRADFPNPIHIVAVATQGRECWDCESWRQCVTAYKLRYLNTANQWVYYSGGSALSGNTCSGDQNAVVKHTVDFTAKSVELRPTSWSGHISMRYELYGKHGNVMTTPIDGPESRRTGVAACDGDAFCIDGKVKPYVEWTDSDCETQAKGEVSENIDGGSAGTFPAVANREGRSLTYSVSTTSRATSCPGGELFTVSAGAELRTAGELDFEACPWVVVAIQANDGSGYATCEVRVTVLNANDKPDILDGQSREVFEDAGLNDQVGTPLQATDPDAEQTLTYAITSGNTNDVFKVGKCNGQLFVASPADLDYETKDTYTLRITVTDDAKVPLNDFADVVVNVRNANDPPTFDRADFGLSVGETASVGTTVGAITATDNDVSDTVTYTITRQDEPVAFSIDSSGTLKVAFAVLNYETKTNYDVTVVADDSKGGVATTTQRIAVQNENDSPSVLPQSFSVQEAAPADTTLGTVVATDQDTGAWGTLAYSISGGDSGGAFKIDSSSGALQVNSPSAIDYETTTKFDLSVTVVDGGSKSSVGAVTVFVDDVNEKPTVNDQTFSVDENSPVGTTVGTVVASDPDIGQGLLYSITGGAADLFEVQLSTGVIKVKQAALDFETTSSYTISVKVVDSGSPTQEDSATMTININNINEAPVVADQEFHISENPSQNAPVGTVVATDDDGDAMTFSILSGNTLDAFKFGTGGQILVDAPSNVDYESLTLYTLTVEVSDGKGGVTQGTIKVWVDDVNEPPAFEDATRSVGESAPVNTPVESPYVAVDPDQDPLTYTITSGNSAGIFTIAASTGQVTVAKAGVMDALTTSSYTLTVQASDSILTATGTLTVNVVDNNDAPVVAPQSFDINENTAQNGVIGTVVGSDPDPGQELTWSIQGKSPDFLIASGTGVLSVNLANLDYEGKDVYEITVQATDNGSPIQLSSTAVVTINLVDINEHPAIPDASMDVEEGVLAGTLVGTPLEASDPDTKNEAFNSYTYSIAGGNSAGYFQINSATGQLSVAQDGLDYERTPQYTLTVRVTDSLGLTDDGTVVIRLEDLNDAPALQASAIVVDENQPLNAALGPAIQASDQESNSQTLSFAITGANCWGGDIAASGGLVWAQEPAGSPRDLTVAFKVQTGRDAILYLGEDMSTSAPQYRLFVSQPFTGVPPVTKLTRCSGGVCEPVATANTPTLVHSDKELVPFWVRLQTVVNGAYPTPNWWGMVRGNRVAENKAYSTNEGGATAAALNDGSRTMLGWVKTTSASIPFSFGGGNSASCNLAWAVHLKDDNADVLGGCSANDHTDVITDADSYKVVLDGQWHHVAATYDSATKAISVFVDGKKVGSASHSGKSYATSAGYRVGGWADFNEAFDGELRDVRFYGAALSADQVNAARLGLDRVVTVKVGSGLDATDSNSLAATLTDGTSGSRPPLPVYVGMTTTFGYDASFTSVCFEGTEPLSTSMITLDAVTGQLSAATSGLNYEEKHVYGMEVTVTDDGVPPLTGSAIVTVTLNNLNEKPWFVPGPLCSAGTLDSACFAVDENSPKDTPVGRIEVRDQDVGQTVAITVTAGNTGGAFRVDADTGDVFVNADILNFEQSPFDDFVLTIQAVDSDPNVPQTTEGRVSIKINNVNEPPSIQPHTRRVRENSAAGTDFDDPITASDVDSGDTLSFSLTGTSASLFDIDATSGQLSLAAGASMNFEDTALYHLTVVVTDSGGLTDSAVLTVEVVDVNEPPVIQDATREIRENSDVATLVGDAITATDVDDDLLIFTITGGDDTEGLFKIGACSGQIELTAASVNFEARNKYTLEVTVTDDGVDPSRLSDKATITINVVDVNEPPVLLPATRSIPENSPASTVVDGAAVVGSDVDAGQTLTYTLVDPRTDGGVFEISPATGVVSVNTAALDYEATQVMTVTVRATDDGTDPHAMHADALLTINILDVNEAPTMAAGQQVSVPENSAADTPAVPGLTCSDPDAGDSLAFSFVAANAMFKLDGSSIVVVDAGLNHEETDSYTVAMQCTDAAGLNSQQDVTILVTDVNEQPTLADTTLHVDENSGIGALVGAPLPGTDVDEGQELTYSFVTGPGYATVDEFSFSSTVSGQIEVRLPNELDYETKQQYSFQVRAQDNGSPPLTTVAAVTVIVDDLNEAPMFSVVEPDLSVSENSDCTGADAGLACTPIMGDSPITATDPDGDSLTFSITGGDGASMFTIDASTGALEVAPCTDYLTEDCLNFETKESYVVQVTVSDGDLSAVKDMTIRVIDVNEAPTIPAQSRNLPERLTLDSGLEKRFVGSEIITADVDREDTKQFKVGPCNGRTACDNLHGNDDGMFTIDDKTGQLILADPSSPRYVVNAVLLVEVQVTDKGGLWGKRNISVTITDQNDKPHIQVPSSSLDINENTPIGTEVLASVTVSDLDTLQTHTFELEKGEPSFTVDVFAVDHSTGRITLKSAVLDYETTKTYRLYITTTDSHSQPLSGSAWFTVNVKNVNEHPALSDASLSIAENTAPGTAVGLPITGTDVDAGDAATLVYTWEAADASTASHFLLDPSTGQVTVGTGGADGPLNFESKTSYTYTITATDTGDLTATATATIAIMDVNEMPTANDATFSVTENVAWGTVVGTIIAGDVDAAEVLTYELSSQAWFSIDRLGQVTVVDDIDFEEAAKHDIVVTVTDSGGATNNPLSTTAALTINVIDTNDVSVSGFSSNGVTEDGLNPFVTNGGETVYIHGTNFGPRASGGGVPEAVITATYGRVTGKEYEATSCGVVRSDDQQLNTLVRCTTAPGTGKGHKWIVTVNGNNVGAAGGGGEVTSTALTAYFPPSITRVDNAGAIPTAGDTDIVLVGQNFGFDEKQTVTVTYGPRGTGYTQTCTVTVPHEQVTCKTQAGVGFGLDFSMEIDSQVSAVHSGPYSYAPPVISYMTGASLLNTAGGEDVTIHGTNLGAASGAAAGTGVDGLTGVVTTSYSNAGGWSYPGVGCRVTVAHTTVVCRTSPGVGRDHSWSITVGGQTSAPSTTSGSVLADGQFRKVSYKVPVITGVEGPGARNGSTAGGQTVIIKGEQFGPVDSALSVTPESKIGASYGRVGIDTFPRYLAVHCTVTVSNFKAECLTAVGTGRGYSWRVSIGAQQSEIFDAETAYAPPVLTDFTGFNVGADTEGNEIVYIEGRQFGTVAANSIDSVTYGETAREYDADCDVSTDHTFLTCKTSQGAGAGLSWSVVIDGQRSVTPTTSYSAPSITGIESGAAGVDVLALNTDGAQSVLLRGDDFGPSDDYLTARFGEPTTYLEAVTYGPSGTEYTAVNCVVEDHDKVRCDTAPGVGSNLEWQVVIKGQTSALFKSPVSYAPPTISKLSRYSAPTNGGTLVTVSGTNFGLKDQTAKWSIEFGGLVPDLLPESTAIDATTGEHQIVFSVPEGQGRNKTISVHITTFSDTVIPSEPVMFHYEDPHIDHVIPEAGGTVDSRFLFIEGRNFGVNGFVRVTFTDEFGVEQSTDLSPTKYTHELVEAFFNGEKGNVQIVRTTETSNAVSFVHLAPSISNLCGGDGLEDPAYDTRGGGDLTISADNMGTSLSAVNITVGGKPCPISKIVPVTPESQALSKCSAGLAVQEGEDKSEITCIVPSGMGTRNVVKLFRLGQASRLGFYVDYQEPIVDSVWPLTLGTRGGEVVTFYGRNFGEANVVAFLAGYTFENCTVANHTVVWCLSPEGKGGLLHVGPVRTFREDFAAGQQWNPDGSVLLSYHKPQIHGWPTQVPTAGGTLSFTGTNFGPFDASAKPIVRVVRTPAGRRLAAADTVTTCELSTWTHELIECELQPGEGGNLAFTVEVAGQTSSGASVSFFKPRVDSVAPNHASTRGGNEIEIFGENFGLSPTVKVGPFQVPPADVLQFNHTYIKFKTPEGLGDNLLVTVVAGDQTSEDDQRFHYDPPEITAVELHSKAGATLSTVGTVGGDVVTIIGTSLGKAQSVVYIEGGRLRDPLRCEGANPLTCTLYGPTRVLAEAELLVHDHEVIKFTMPAGMGTNIVVRLTVGGRNSVEGTPFMVSYNRPFVDQVSPDVPDARGDTIKVMGFDFGEDAHPDNQNVTVLINGVECTSLSFLPREVKNGFSRNPYVTCRTPSMTVGWKNVTLFAALQSDYVDGACRSNSTKCELVRTACTPGSYGREGELCLGCPRGTKCDGGEAEPVSLKYWWHQNGTQELCPDRNSGTADDIRAYVAAVDKYYRTNVLEFRKVDEDTGRLVRYSEVNDLCVDHPTLCSHTYCVRMWSGERVVSPMAVPCEPKWACTGDNQCAKGYAGTRCAVCDSCYQPTEGAECEKYYRRAGECVECPKNPLMLVAGFLALLICLCIAGYIFAKKNVHLSFMSVTVDYFQILAMFANSRVTWPPLVKELFHIMSLFNLNLEITAPECSFPDLGYKMKWFFVEGLPLAAIFVFLMFHCLAYCKKRIILRQKQRAMTHFSTLVGIFLITFYYLYLYLTRTILDVFNCAPTDPFDGYTYLEVVFERCNVPGGLHLTLLPYAIIALCAYTIGYPVLCAYLLFKNKAEIMEDQLLRAQNKGATRLENPHSYDVRKRYHKIYYHYRPDKFYWMLMIVGRKFLIAFTALMFNKNPAFQLAVALLVVFSSYVLQVKNQPYMSMSDRANVLKDHQRKAREGVGMHPMLAVNIGKVHARGKKVTRGVTGRSSMQNRARQAARNATLFFFNTNTVEATLLLASVLVILCGIMFESGQFESDFYQEQRDVVTTFTLLIIFISMLYIAIVFVVETRAQVCPDMCANRGPGSKKRKALKTGKSLKSSGMELTAMTNPMRSVDDDHLEMAGTNPLMNPMFEMQSASAAGPSVEAGKEAALFVGDRPPAPANWARAKAYHESVVEQADALFKENAVMRDELARLKRETEVARTATAGAHRLAGGRKKREFGATKASRRAGAGGRSRRARRARKTAAGAGATSPRSPSS